MKKRPTKQRYNSLREPRTINYSTQYEEALKLNAGNHNFLITASLGKPSDLHSVGNVILQVKNFQTLFECFNPMFKWVYLNFVHSQSEIIFNLEDSKNSLMFSTGFLKGIHGEDQMNEWMKGRTFEPAESASRSTQ